MKKIYLFCAKQIQRAAWPKELKVAYYINKLKYSVKLLKFNFIYPELGLSCLLHMKKKSLVCVTKVG